MYIVSQYSFWTELIEIELFSIPAFFFFFEDRVVQYSRTEIRIFSSLTP